jgi:TatD DNase family protein
MIDTHCHLEQPVYDKDREVVIEKCKHELHAVVTCAPDPKHYAIAFEMVDTHANFVFVIAGIHPEYVKNFSEEEIEQAMKVLEENRDKLVGIGETGLDYDFIQDAEGRVKQREMFVKFIRFAERLELPVVVHIRNGPDKEKANAFEHAIEILEKENAKRVQLHMFGSRPLLQRALDNGWYISANAIILRSKNYKKLVRDTPLERLMLETDAPWLHPNGDNKARNDPTGVRVVAEKIAEIKKTTVEEVGAATTKNAIEFFKLKIDL